MSSQAGFRIRNGSLGVQLGEKSLSHGAGNPVSKLLE